MKNVKIGDEVAYMTWRGIEKSATIVNIEICKIGEKEGTSVSCCDLDHHSNGTITLSNDHWCYFDQVIRVNKRKQQ